MILYFLTIQYKLYIFFTIKNKVDVASVGTHGNQSHFAICSHICKKYFRLVVMGYHNMNISKEKKGCFALNMLF